jgi:hypothetical protein
MNDHEAAAAAGRALDERRSTTMEAMLALTGATATLLWVLAAILVIAGIVTLIRGSVVAGVVLIIVGLLVGPGGASVFK